MKVVKVRVFFLEVLANFTKFSVEFDREKCCM